MATHLDQSKALASHARVSILNWLRAPQEHFAHQETGDPAEIGVCVTLLTEKLKMSQPTVSRHLELLKRANFVTTKRIGRWSFFARNEKGIAAYKHWLNESL
ncbi:MAG: ArsR/SmtB family transcription factor [Burkholderiaceae bacterium]